MTKECQQQKSPKFVKNLFSVLVICCLMCSSQVLLAYDFTVEFCKATPNAICKTISVGAAVGAVAGGIAGAANHPALIGAIVFVADVAGRSTCDAFKEWWQSPVDRFCHRVFGTGSLIPHINGTTPADL